uniref:MADF domain-containing protein n=1 Tax=Sinocyclocheilus anshuiensis TaxID=1608454 RepID=A0A671K904_9TELE
KQTHNVVSMINWAVQLDLIIRSRARSSCFCTNRCRGKESQKKIDVECLLSLVSEDILFDKSYSDYKNIDKKKVLWQVIAEKMVIMVRDRVKVKWKDLRDAYTRSWAGCQKESEQSANLCFWEKKQEERIEQCREDDISLFLQSKMSVIRRLPPSKQSCVKMCFHQILHEAEYGHPDILLSPFAQQSPVFYH